MRWSCSPQHRMPMPQGACGRQPKARGLSYCVSSAAADWRPVPPRRSPPRSSPRIWHRGRNSLPPRTPVDAEDDLIERDGTRREVDAPLGASVLQVARRHDIDIEGACEGSLACSTCHVIVDPEWYDLLKEASEDEDDMLDLAFNLTTTSRLGCQIIITEELDGLTVRLPAATRNLLFG